MKTFTYKSPYGEYPDCFFQVSRYRDNDNLAIEIWSNEEGPITRVTVNPDIKIDHTAIAIKNYSENEGMVSWLISQGIIEDKPNALINSGWVTIPIHTLTPLGKEMLGL